MQRHGARADALLDLLPLLPVATAFRYFAITLRIAAHLKSQQQAWVRWFAKARKGTTQAGLTRKLESSSVRFLASLKLQSKLQPIIEDVIEHNLVTLNTMAQKQGVNLATRLDAEQGAASNQASLRRISPKRAKGRLRATFGDLMKKKDTQRLIKDMTKENAKALRDFTKTEQAKLARLTATALRDGWTTKRYAKEIAARTKVNQRRAFNIARDQTMRINSQVNKALAFETEARRFTWLHSGNPNGRPHHIARHGKTYAFARPPSEMPGDLPNCMCVAEPIWR